MADQRIAESRRVLVVEDEMTIALLIEDKLLDLGAEVVGRRRAWTRPCASQARRPSMPRSWTSPSGAGTPTPSPISWPNGAFRSSSARGYSDWALDERHRDRPRLTKPYTSKDLEDRVL